MGRKYMMNDNSKLHFVTFTVINWIDIFIRPEYIKIIYDSIKHCQKHKGLEVYAYCIMTSHVHAIIGTETGVLSDIVRDFKSFTSRHIRKEIESSEIESRKWMMWMMKREGERNTRNKDFQFWMQHNQPVELSSAKMVKQRLDYIHNNPLATGLVDKADEWVHSSAGDYFGTRKSQIDVILIEPPVIIY